MWQMGVLLTFHLLIYIRDKWSKLSDYFTFQLFKNPINSWRRSDKSTDVMQLGLWLPSCVEEIESWKKRGVIKYTTSSVRPIYRETSEKAFSIEKQCISIYLSLKPGSWKPNQKYSWYSQNSNKSFETTSVVLYTKDVLKFFIHFEICKRRTASQKQSTSYTIGQIKWHRFVFGRLIHQIFTKFKK